MHLVCVHPRPRLLCPTGGLPSTLPPHGAGGQGKGGSERECDGQEGAGGGEGQETGGGEEGREGWKQWEGQEGRDRVSSATSPVSPPSCSGDGSATSGASEEVKSPAAMAQAVKVHQDTSRVMYFA